MPADASLLLSRVRRLLEPPRRVALSEWADQYRRLSSEASASAGPWRSLPFQREPLDAIAPGSPWETVVFLLGPVRWANRELLLNLITYIIAVEPGPALVVQPTLAMTEAFSKDRIAPMLRDTPGVEGQGFGSEEPRSRKHDLSPALYRRPSDAGGKQFP